MGFSTHNVLLLLLAALKMSDKINRMDCSAIAVSISSTSMPGRPWVAGVSVQQRTSSTSVHGCVPTAITALASTGPAVKAPIPPAEPLRHTRAAALPGSGSRPRGAGETSWALARGEVSPPSVVVRSGHPSLHQPGGDAHPNVTSRPVS